MNRFSDTSAEDELDRLLGPVSFDSLPAAPATPAPAAPMTADEEQASGSAPVVLDKTSPYFRPCPRCGGSGFYRGFSRYGSTCFACKGVGGSMAKTTAAERAKNRAAAIAREEAKAMGRWEAFAHSYPEEAAHILAGKERGFGFLVDMHEHVRKHGYLTEKQFGAVARGVERDREYAARKAEQARKEAERAPIIADKLVAAFEAAKLSGLKNPVLRFEGFSITPAKATSANAGALYVKDRGTYLGKIVGTEFKASWEGKQRTDLAERIASVMGDPVEAAKKYGKETGICSCCGRTLTDPVSVAAGIGPICAEGWGF